MCRSEGIICLETCRYERTILAPGPLTEGGRGGGERESQRESEREGRREGGREGGRDEQVLSLSDDRFETRGRRGVNPKR